MRHRHNAVNRILLGAVLALGMAASVPAAEKTSKNAKTNEQMDPAMMQAIKFGTPAENHKRLEPFAGKWTHTIRHWMKPGDKAQESQGTNDNTWILGGRFLKQEARGNWAGQPFEGLGYTGFDNVRGEFQSIWMDGMSTGIMKVAGTYDAATKTINQSGTFSCPMTGEKDMWYRSELKVIDNDNHTYTAYGKGPDGKEFKTMEISYTRAK